MNNFMPDSGKIMVYRSGGGFGVRLDSGNAYTGAIITPYYDSLLVKTTTYGRTHKEAAEKMLRVLKEFRIRGVKTNIGFLINVLKSPEFIAGTYNVNFIDDHPELFNLPVVQTAARSSSNTLAIRPSTVMPTPAIRTNRNLKPGTADACCRPVSGWDEAEIRCHGTGKILPVDQRTEESFLYRYDHA